jgi:hypothetical protein
MSLEQFSYRDILFFQQQVAHAMVSSIYQQEMSRLARVSGHHHPMASPNGTLYSQSENNLSPHGRRESESESSMA